MKEYRQYIHGVILLIAFKIVFVFGAYAQTPETALKHYVEKIDTTFKWEVKDSYKANQLTVYQLLLTSQTWKDIVWVHQLTVLIPDEVKQDGALLLISGGSIENGIPRWNDNKDDYQLKAMEQIAINNKAVVAVLRQTPNQPLYGGRKEDELISMTLHNFKKDGDYEWPLLFPMVKSAVKAMDAVQVFVAEKYAKRINKFIITGFSKRGWTTWLTGATDDRVIAIAPMVIDVLNMPVSLQYQIETWGDYSVEIQDYVNLGIPQEALTSSGREITTMIDPYSYRKNLLMPKMIFMGTNDPYWVVDNVKNYIDDIPGKNILHYVPNVGHDLGDGRQAARALDAFVSMTLDGYKYPESNWKLTKKSKKVKILVNATADLLMDVIIWTASSSDKDFRDEEWISTNLDIHDKDKIELTLHSPETGYKAYYIDLKYMDPLGKEYTQSTRVFLLDSKGIL